MFYVKIVLNSYTTVLVLNYFELEKKTNEKLTIDSGFVVNYPIKLSKSHLVSP